MGFEFEKRVDCFSKLASTFLRRPFLCMRSFSLLDGGDWGRVSAISPEELRNGLLVETLLHVTTELRLLSVPPTATHGAHEVQACSSLATK